MTRGIAFLPWVTARGPRKIGRYRLVPYRLGAADNAASAIPHAHIDSALRFYRDLRRKPIKQCLLIAPAKKQIGQDLSDAEIDDIFTFGELLAFSALAQRHLFQNHFGYVGRDHYALFFQRIPENFTGSIALTYRRRDGGTTHGVGAEDFPIPIPAHVSEQATLAYDAELLKGLLKAWDTAPQKSWLRLYEAIVGCNLANTDSDSLPPAMELVLLHGAIERLLAADSNTNDFVAKMGPLLRPKRRVTCRTKGAIQPKPKHNEPYVLEAWARDFCKARGSVAHGHNYAVTKPTWSLSNHLLLASYLLPLLVKRALAREHVLKLTEYDVARINIFEPLACFDHFARQSSRTTPVWRRLMSEVDLEMQSRQMRRTIAAAVRGQGSKESDQ